MALPLATVTDVTPASAGSTSAVTVSTGEDPTSLVVSWAAPPTPVTAAVAVYPAGMVSGSPVASVPVAPGNDAVVLPTLPPASSDVATVTLAGASGATVLGPSAPFSPVPAAHRVSNAAATPGPCGGSGYGPGRVSVDGYAGFQGSYCLPPAFTAGTGAFCADHGLDYPFGVPGYTWASSVVPLVNQHGMAADPANVARLAWIIATWGVTPDPARAVAVGIITHAVMGDYPGLAVADLDPPRLTVSGGDPAAITADVGAMWHASGSLAGPYGMLIQPGTGPFSVGGTYQGKAVLTGRGGGPEAGVPVSLAGATGATVTPAAGTTGADGSFSFTWSPTAAQFSLVATTGTPMPGTVPTLWRPVTAPVPVQRVLTAGPAITPAASVKLAANTPASLTLVKVSADPAWVPIGAGFSFDVAQQSGPGGAWQTVAQRQTAADGTMAPITGLAAGAYRVTETSHPPAFTAGGPWSGQVAAGQDAHLTLTDQVATQAVAIAKTGDDVAAHPIGAGVTFSVAFDADNSGRFATPEGTWTTGADGTTPAHNLAPGRYQATETTAPAGYQLAAPVTFTVAPASSSGAAVQTVKVTDAAVRGGLTLRKVDADSGALVAGAVLQVTRAPSSGAAAGQVMGTWTTGTSPINVSGLLAGSYTVTEQTAPPGYQLPASDSQTVTLAPGQTLAVTIADHRTAPTASPSPSAATPASPSPSPAPSQLAFTGLPTWRLVTAGLLVILAGLGLVTMARRRR